MWLIIRIIVGKSRGVEDTREIPKEPQKDGDANVPGRLANGKVVENGEVSATNHGKTDVCSVHVC